MAKEVALDDLIDELDSQSETMAVYLDRDTGVLVAIDEANMIVSDRDDAIALQEWERELVEVIREVENGSKRYVQLPSKWDVHEWEIMRRFCDTVEDDRLNQLLVDTIRGRGAFRRFKDELDRNGLLDRWFDFKRSALRDLAIEWCIENDVQFIRP